MYAGAAIYMTQYVISIIKVRVVGTPTAFHKRFSVNTALLNLGRLGTVRELIYPLIIDDALADGRMIFGVTTITVLQSCIT